MQADLEIVKACLSGDEKAFRNFYERFAPKMLALCLRFFNSREVAEDVLQESFIVVFDKLFQYNETGSLEGWIRKIVLHKCIAVSKLSTNQLYLTEQSVSDHSESMEENELDLLSEVELISLISELPTKSKLVFNLYAIEGLRHKEIAELLGISEGTSKSHLHDARLNLRRRINESIIKKSNRVA